MKKTIFVAVLMALAPFVARAATLSISPSSQSVKTGDTFTVTISLDTQNTNIDGVDLRYLNYNPSLLQIQDSNSSTAGVQIAPGTLMPATLANSVNTSLGRVTFSQVTAGGNKYKGSGTLATISFKALSAGSASVTLNYTPNSTTDSNIAAAGSDVLNAVVNGVYTISGTTVAPSTPSAGSSGNTSGGGGGTTSSGSGVTTSYPGVSAGTAMITQNLALGSKTAEVLILQNFLVGLGYLTADNATGFFGNMTQAAVQKFQVAQGIVSSGSPSTTGYGAVGPTTRAKINALRGSYAGGSGSSGTAGIGSTVSATLLLRNLAFGSKGSDVTILQNFLVGLGYLTADNATGFFGNMTQAAVQKFQVAQGIVSSGSPLTTGYGAVGPTTRAKINALLGTSGSTSGVGAQTSLQAQIEALQKQVNELLLKLQQSQ